eukprot:4316471-Prymnesium_polylepis.2
MFSPAPPGSFPSTTMTTMMMTMLLYLIRNARIALSPRATAAKAIAACVRFWTARARNACARLASYRMMIMFRLETPPAWACPATPTSTRPTLRSLRIAALPASTRAR